MKEKLKSYLSKKKLAFFLVLVFGALLPTALQLVNAHGGNTGLIHACYNARGLVFIVGVSEACGANETALDWPKPNYIPVMCQQCTFVDWVNPGDYSEGATANKLVDALSGKDVSGALLASSNLGYGDLSDTNFTNARLVEASFRNANLTDVNFTNANLTGAYFNNDGGATYTVTTLENANLTNANLTNANLTGVTDMNTATLTGVTWDNTICPDGTNSGDHSDTCSGHLTP